MSHSILGKKGVQKYDLRKGDIQLSPHFKLSEFACKDGTPIVLVDPALVKVLENIRKHFNKPVRINSGYRTASHNRKVGGSSNSQHVKGTAADIVVSGVSPDTVASYCEKIGVDGVGRYRTFTHVDTRGYKARWKG